VLSGVDTTVVSTLGGLLGTCPTTTSAAPTPTPSETP
jgi:hypothetical protein